MIKKCFILAVYFLSPVVLMLAIYNANPSYYGTAGFLPMVLGSAGYTWLCYELIIIARPKWIEYSFGLDRFYRFHSLMAVCAIVISFVHKLLKEEVYSESVKTQIGDAALVIFIAAAGLALVFLVDTIVAIIKPLGWIKTQLKKLKIGNYSIQVLLHNANLIAVVLIFIHVMLTFSARNGVVKALYILYFGISVAFYFYHKFIRKLFLKQFVVEATANEAQSVNTLKLRPKTSKLFRFKPGQFGFLKIKDQSVSAEAHPFSFSSGGTDGGEVLITIKALGDWTSGVSAIKPGATAYIDGPYGRFSPLLYDTKDGIALLAGGVGITPMLSIIRYYYKTEKNKKIILFWGANSGSEFICKDEFKTYLSEMANFTLVPVAAKDSDFEGEKGFITESLMVKYLTEKGYDIMALHYFICGPQIMQKNVKKALVAMNIRNKNIHYESFSL